MSFANLWGFCGLYANYVVCAKAKVRFIEQFNSFLANMLGLGEEELYKSLKNQAELIARRGQEEKQFWQKEVGKIQQYSREEAINELIRARKIQEKIAQIDAYVRGLTV